MVTAGSAARAENAVGGEQARAARSSAWRVFMSFIPVNWCCLSYTGLRARRHYTMLHDCVTGALLGLKPSLSPLSWPDLFRPSRLGRHGPDPLASFGEANKPGDKVLRLAGRP